MPELPDIVVYVEALERRIVGQALRDVRLQTPFLLRTVDPPLSALSNKRVTGARRLGKRIVIALEDELYVVIHLMIAGRLHWRVKAAKARGRADLAVFEFDTGSLVLTEAGTTRRASLHIVRGDDGLEQFARGGLEVLDASAAEFAARLRSENHTLKRALTDPRLFSGMGNAYSDEILFRARLSPVKLTSRVTDAEVARLHAAIRDVLVEWTERLRAQTADQFPEKVTAFRPEMAVHGKYGEPCVECGTPVQRIRYADNETNYCARCQTDGKLLADRALSRLLKGDWPKSIDEMA